MRTRARSAALAATAIAAAAALAIFGLASSGGGRMRTAPPLPREALVGAPVTVTDLLARAHGRSTAIVFWASWCTPCSREAPALQRFSASAVGRGRIVGVDWSDAVSGARAFVARYRWSFPNMRDGDGSVGNAYGITGLPSTFVLDRGARITAVLRGPQDEASLERALRSAEHA